MEVKQKIDTKMLQMEGGRIVRLDYCLLAQLDRAKNCFTGPYGMEIVGTKEGGVYRECCRNMTNDYKKAVALIHAFAASGVTPMRMLQKISKDT